MTAATPTRRNRLLLAGTALAALAAAPAAADIAPDPAEPFTILGPIEHFELKDDEWVNHASDAFPPCEPKPCSPPPETQPAEITVHGITVLLPRNLLVQLPGRFMTPWQIFRDNHGADSGRSGLALDDRLDAGKINGEKPPYAAFEAELIGNIVTLTRKKNGGGSRPVYVAAIAKITQHGLATGTGIVEAIDMTSGQLTIRDGTLPDTTLPEPAGHRARVMLADPDGIYGMEQGKADLRFSVDGENPTVHAVSGYPMCVPSTGVAKCPPDNRLIVDGNQVKTFVMGHTPLTNIAGEPGIPACSSCDPHKPVPIAVGDLVTYSGTLDKDGLIWAHTLVAEVGAYTESGTAPSYVSVETSLLGTDHPDVCEPLTGSAAADPACLAAGRRLLAQEGKDRFRIEGFRTNARAALDVFAVDHLRGGAERCRRLPAIGARSEAVLGRFRRTPGEPTGVLRAGDDSTRGAFRELVVYAPNCAPKTDPATDDADCSMAACKEGQPGAYRAPVAEFFLPENRVPGDPQPPVDVECMSFLFYGGEKTGLKDAGGKLILTAKLAPWPGRYPGATTPICDRSDQDQHHDKDDKPAPLIP